MRRAVILLIVLGFGVAACGVPSDSSPREIAANRLPDDLFEEPSTSSIPEVPGSRTAQVYLLAGGRLQPVQREVASRSPADVLTALFTGATEGDVQALTSLIPEGLTAQTEVIEGGLIVVNLSSEINRLVGVSQQHAYAQMVYTLTDLRNVSRVQFRVDGHIQAVPTDTGNDPDPVDRGDFDSVAPSTEADEEESTTTTVAPPGT